MTNIERSIKLSIDTVKTTVEEEIKETCYGIVSEIREKINSLDIVALAEYVDNILEELS